MTFVPTNYSTVTAVPFGKVSGLVVPLSVIVTGNVVVVPVGIISERNTVKYPIGAILRKPKAISTASVFVATLVEIKYGIPPAFVVIF
jgi:hypothetical protein